jgi:Ca2+-binding EF-hand superfamily protein
MENRDYQLFLCETQIAKEVDENGNEISSLLGDMLGEGSITVNSINTLLEIITSKLSLESIYERIKDDIFTQGERILNYTLGQFKVLCDVNQDGRIDGKDLAELAKFLPQPQTIDFLPVPSPIPTPATPQTHSFVRLKYMPVLELGSSTSNSTGQAFNIEFYSKIDGTHELTFELPQFYFDEEIGENVLNPLIEYVGNKCQLELHLDGKTYFMVVNSRTDEEKNDSISYRYECTDAFIEELSKSGYGIVFSDEVEGNGLGTIHEFAQQVAAGTEWVYDKEKTGTLYEYEKELTWIAEQNRYDEVHKPVPVHKVKYIPELKRYCNELKYCKTSDKVLAETKPVYKKYYFGDVNEDGKFTKEDLDLIIDAGYNTLLTERQKILAKLNSEGSFFNVNYDVFCQAIKWYLKETDPNFDEEKFNIEDDNWTIDTKSFMLLYEKHQPEELVAIIGEKWPGIPVYINIRPEYYWIGDINNDGFITQEDLEAIINLSVDAETNLTEEQLILYDINQDGVVSAIDARPLLTLVNEYFKSIGEEKVSGWKIPRDELEKFYNDLPLVSIRPGELSKSDLRKNNSSSWVVKKFDLIEDHLAIFKDIVNDGIIGYANTDSTNYRVGDVTGEGVITEEDLEAILNIASMEETELTEEQLILYDIDQDGVVSAIDVQRLSRLINEYFKFTGEEMGWGWSVPYEELAKFYDSLPLASILGKFSKSDIRKKNLYSWTVKKIEEKEKNYVLSFGDINNDGKFDKNDLKKVKNIHLLNDQLKKLADILGKEIYYNSSAILFATAMKEYLIKKGIVGNEENFDIFKDNWEISAEEFVNWYNSLDKNYPAMAQIFKIIGETWSYIKTQIGTKTETTVLSGGAHRIYSYDDTEQVVSSTVQNYLYNGDDFVDLVGWFNYTKTDEAITYGVNLSSRKVKEGENEIYVLDIPVEGTPVYLVNETTQSANKTISANEPYVFKWTDVENSGGVINGIEIYDGDPRKYSYKKIYSSDESFSPNNYYTIKTTNYISSPYIVFKINGSLSIKSLEFFPVKGTVTQGIDAETNYLTLLSQLQDGDEIDVDTQLPLMQKPNDSISSYTHKQVKYFIRDNYLIDKYGVETQVENNSEKDTITYVELGQEDVDEENNTIISFTLQDKILIDRHFEFQNAGELSLISVEELPKTGIPRTVYKNKKDNKYYQYYELTVNEITNGKWDYAFYDEGANDKRRTLSIEKSNRFNIIQEIAELFRVWPVFEMNRDPDTGETTKKFWFREKCIKQNFSGFHKNVNIESLSRTIDSNNVITKLYVEDQENDFAEDGFVTIRTSPLNPWGENYYYNFRYYIDQQLLNGNLVEKDKETLYYGKGNSKGVKQINLTIRDLNDKIVNAKPELTELSARLKSLSLSIAACTERITSLKADVAKYTALESENSPDIVPDHQNALEAITRQEDYQNKYQSELDTVQSQYDTLKEEIDKWTKEVSSLQKEKTNLIYEFENKYSQFIKEGVWSDSSYSDNTQYYLDSIDVMNTSSMPQVEWSISVIDNSWLEEIKDLHFEVGDQTILVDNEFFMKKPNENYQFEVLITGIRKFLDKATGDTIEVRNFLTSFEDIFQRISAATQTLELKEQTYDKVDYFTSDGKVDSSILQNSLLNNSLTLANSTDNSYILDNTGLHLQSIINPSKKLRVTADGVFISNSTDPNTGEPQWMTGISASGVNASVITSGEINTSLIKIYSENTPTFSWNDLGITAYKYKEASVDPNSFIRFDNFGLYSVDGNSNLMFNYDSEGNPWFKRINRSDAIEQILTHAAISITDKGFNLNVDSDKGSIRLGYVDKEQEGIYYGLEIKKGDEVVVQILNDGVLRAKGAEISGDFLAGDPSNDYTELTVWNVSETQTFPVLLFNNIDNKTLTSPSYLERKSGISMEWDEELQKYVCFSVTAEHERKINDSSYEQVLGTTSNPIWYVDLHGEVLLAPRKYFSFENLYSTTKDVFDYKLALFKGLMNNGIEETLLAYTSPDYGDYFIGASPRGLWTGEFFADGRYFYVENGVIYDASRR